MSWRGLHLSKPSKLSLDQHALEVCQFQNDEDNSDPIRFPIEDLAWLILDTQQTRISGAVLAACMEQGAPVIISAHVTCRVASPCPFTGITSRLTWCMSNFVPLNPCADSYGEDLSR
jgi:hypothetical protein